MLRRSVKKRSVDEDLLDKNLMSVASSLLYCYSVVCWLSDWGYGYKRLCCVKKRHQ